MPNERQVYLLDPQKLKQEVIAVAFAKTSRSPQSFQEIAAELTDEKSAEFHEKWVVGYGHASVAEHAILHVAVENISRLAVECLESNRLASYTEKSTRYQKWGPDDFYFPEELKEHLLLPLYQETCRKLFEAYQQTLPKVREVICLQHRRGATESDGAYERRIRSEYVDVCRFYLPAASLANVGMTINARALEHAIRKMLSHPLVEVRSLGQQVKTVAQSVVPTLVKYADAAPYLSAARQALLNENLHLPETRVSDENWCRLVNWDALSEENLLSAALFRYSGDAYTQINAAVKNMSLDEKRKLAYQVLGAAGKFDIPLRELEHTSYTFELTMDQGAYFEFKRHRMMTQSPQALSTRLGYAVPRAIVEAGCESLFREAMEMAAQAYNQLAEFDPEVASYIVPNAYNRRVLASFNLRSADHFIALRSAHNAHFSIRRVAFRMAEEIRKVTPLLGSHLRAAPGENWQQVEEIYFAETAARPTA